MTYSKKLKEKILKRMVKGVSLRKINRDTAIKMTILHKWKKSKFVSEGKKYMRAVETSKEITQLIKQGRMEEAKEKCREFPNDGVIQSQYITILIKEGTKESLEEARRIAKDKIFKNNESIKAKLKIVEDLLENFKFDGNMLKTHDISSRHSNVLDDIKTRLYYNHITLDFVQEIKQDNSELTQWEKTIVLLAIYDKQKSQKMSAQILKEAKKTFANDNEKVKVLNKLQNAILSKKSRVFSWGMFDEILDWKLNKEICKTLENQSETDKSRKNEEATQIPKAQSKEVPIEVAEKNINTMFAEELIKLKDKIAYKKQEDLTHDFDMVERTEQKPITDFRAKLELILLFRKYGMKSVADNRLKLESEIYDDVNEMYCAQKRNPKFDNTKSVETIMKKIAKVKGNNEYAYQILEKVSNKGTGR